MIFKPIEEYYLKLFQTWRNKWYMYFRQDKLLNYNDQVKWFNSLDDKNIMYAICNDDAEFPIGVAGLTHINWKHRNAELSFYFGEDYVNDRICATVEMLMKEAFERYGLEKVWIEIYDFDPKKKYLEAMDFKLDGTLRNSYFYLKWHNSLIYSMLRQEYEERILF